MNGNEAMSTTKVISEVVYGNTFIAWISGTNDDTYNIYCNSTDICKIDCQSSSACTKLYLHCFGTCYVDCDEENGIDCPFAGDYLDWDPTEAPTLSDSDASGSIFREAIIIVIIICAGMLCLALSVSIALSFFFVIFVTTLLCAFRFARSVVPVCFFRLCSLFSLCSLLCCFVFYPVLLNLITILFVFLCTFRANL